MATRMQQRRGTETQWTTANPVLAAGEIGFEIDTNRFKVGDGINQWLDLDYFASSEALTDLIDGAPELLNTLNELAAAIGNDPEFAQTVSNHVNSTANVHGISDTTALATTTNVLTARDNAIAEAQAYTNNLAVNYESANAVSQHNQSTANVHGIANTLVLATQSEVQNAQTAAQTYTDSEITAHSSLTENVHGIANTLVLVTLADLAQSVSEATVDQSLLAGVGIEWDSENEQFNIDSTVATQEYVGNAVSDHNDLTENIHGIANTLTLATLTDVSSAQTAAESYADSLAGNYDAVGSAANAESYADSAISVHNSETANVHGIANTLALISNSGNQTIDGTLTLSGLIVQGNTTTISTTELLIEDPLIFLASNQYDENLVDVGFSAAYGTEGGNSEVHFKSGFVKDVTDGVWKLFSNVPPIVGNEVDFDNAVYDNLKIGTLEPTVGVAFSDGTQTKEAVPSRTVIQQKTDSYTLSSLDERDDLIEIDKATATTLTIPLDSTLNYPVGTSIDILRSGAGDVTIAGAGGVTVNGTPGLKLRAQWSSATLFKRAANSWLVIGDLSA